jgi:predicted ArsR family transcriptional regulator
VRRTIAHRASTGRATARRRNGDSPARISEYVNDHPQSTASQVAKSLNTNRNTVATRMSQMVKRGEVTEASKG